MRLKIIGVEPYKGRVFLITTSPITSLLSHTENSDLFFFCNSEGETTENLVG